MLKILLDLLGDQCNVGTKSLRSQTEFDKLPLLVCARQRVRVAKIYLLLFHEFRVWTVVDHVLPKDWRGEWRVNILCADILEFPIQDEVIALCTQKYSGLFSKENECEDIAIL